MHVKNTTPGTGRVILFSFPYAVRCVLIVPKALRDTLKVLCFTLLYNTQKAYFDVRQGLKLASVFVLHDPVLDRVAGHLGVGGEAGFLDDAGPVCADGLDAEV